MSRTLGRLGGPCFKKNCHCTESVFEFKFPQPAFADCMGPTYEPQLRQVEWDLWEFMPPHALQTELLVQTYDVKHVMFSADFCTKYLNDVFAQSSDDSGHHRLFQKTSCASIFKKILYMLKYLIYKYMLRSYISPKVSQWKEEYAHESKKIDQEKRKVEKSRRARCFFFSHMRFRTGSIQPECQNNASNIWRRYHRYVELGQVNMQEIVNFEQSQQNVEGRFPIQRDMFLLSRI